MRLLPESEGVYSIRTRKKLKPFDIAKIVIAIVLLLITIGFLFQKFYDFSVGESLKYRYSTIRVNDKKMDFVFEGSGDYTVVFDGDIGTDLTQWLELSDKLNEKNIKTFVYNRQGYGYSDSGEALSIEKQAENLKILLRKAGLTGNFVLVGEGYGSLILTNFAKLYPESVKAMVLINPIDESILSTDSIKKEYRFESLRRNIEKLGSNVGLTYLMDKANISVSLDEYEDKIPEMFKSEFEAHRVMSNYTTAVCSEIDNLTKVQALVKMKTY